MPAYTANGLVLHRLNYGETDKILTLYTREHGKLSAIAKGVRRSGSRLSGATELFTETRFLLATGRNLDVVTQGEIRDSFPALRNDLELLARATYFCELLDRMTQERDTAQSEELYDITILALHMLGEAGGRPDAVVHAYELHLLDVVGYRPILDRCARCDRPLEGRQIGFSPSAGGTLCGVDRYSVEDAFPISHEALEILRALQSGEPESVPSLPFSRKTSAEIARAMRWYVRFRAERDLKSAEFLDQLRSAS